MIHTGLLSGVCVCDLIIIGLTEALVVSVAGTSVNGRVVSLNLASSLHRQHCGAAFLGVVL